MTKALDLSALRAIKSDQDVTCTCGHSALAHRGGACKGITVYGRPAKPGDRPAGAAQLCDCPILELAS